MSMPMSYVIALSSSLALKFAERNLKIHRWSYQIFPAVDGNTVTDDVWNKLGINLSSGGKMIKSKGAQGCWLSHWNLWNKCAIEKEPIIILEHDAMVQDKFPKNIDFDSAITKLYKVTSTKYKPNFGNWSRGAYAYSLTPIQASALIDYAQTHPVQAVDKHIADEIVPWKFYDRDIVVHMRHGPSTTGPDSKKSL